MSGIGRHNYSTNYKSIWKPDLAICPYCGDETCEADWCDVGVGLVQCGPYNCQSCGAIEIGAYDKQIDLSERELETGWYAPGRRYEGCAPTISGQLVGHEAAEQLYNMGLLDAPREGSHL